MIKTLILAMALLPALTGQTTRVRNSSMGVLQTATGNGVGYPSKLLLAWPRSEVHKQYGIPSRVLTAPAGENSFAETDNIECGFKTAHPLAEVYAQMPELSPHPIRLSYHIDKTAAKLGIRQRVESVKILPPAPIPLEKLTRDPAADLPEAAELCGGSCDLYRIQRRQGAYVLAVPSKPTADQLEIGRWVAAGYDARTSDQPWCPAMKMQLTPDAAHVSEIQILVVGLDTALKPGPPIQVTRLGSWNTGRTPPAR